MSEFPYGAPPQKVLRHIIKCVMSTCLPPIVVGIEKIVHVGFSGLAALSVGAGACSHVRTLGPGGPEPAKARGREARQRWVA